jgi:hypothetical protein
MNEVKKEVKKDLAEKNDDNDPNLADDECILEGKKLYDLYRHATKLIE